MLDDSRFNSVELDSWGDFLDWYTQITSHPDFHERRWVFRGEQWAYPYMAPTLEREARASNIPLPDLPKLESRMLNEFKRRLHNYIQDTPHTADLAEWLSLMRHFGAPTRLLDWSYSPFVAAFFAIENSHDAPCVLWAIASQRYTNPELIKQLDEKKVYEYFESENPDFCPEESKRPQAALLHYFIENPSPGLQLINPFRLSERASIQKSVHLIPRSLSVTFEANVAAHEKYEDGLTRIQINMDPTTRKDFIFHLNRVNIDRTTLFPGLQGFAESLKTRMVTPEVLSK